MFVDPSYIFFISPLLCSVASISEYQSPVQLGVCACSPGVESRELFSDTSQLRCWGVALKGKTRLFFAALSLGEKLFLKPKRPQVLNKP